MKRATVNASKVYHDSDTRTRHAASRLVSDMLCRAFIILPRVLFSAVPALMIMCLRDVWIHRQAGLVQPATSHAPVAKKQNAPGMAHARRLAIHLVACRIDAAGRGPSVATSLPRRLPSSVLFLCLHLIFHELDVSVNE